MSHSRYSDRSALTTAMEDMSRRAHTHLLQAELDAANAQNKRLNDENAQLRQRLHQLTNDQRSKATVNVEAKIRAFDLENERDRMYENLERLKKKYNKLHEAYLEKVQRCAAFEDMFKRQKTLTGLVMKSALEQRQNEQQVALAKRLSHAEAENTEAKVAKLQASLDEAYDIIDELEFELESIDYLEMENQRLNTELSALKKKEQRPHSTHIGPRFQAPRGQDHGNNDDDDEAPPRYEEDDCDGATARHLMRQAVVSSTCESCFHDDDADNETLERAALTNSLIRGAEAESHCLRRELLRCRLQNTLRPKADT